MGFKDWFSRAKDLAADNEEAVKDGIDKAADVADDKTGGRFSEQIDQGAETAKDFVDGLDEG
jgi:hypothetical protein